GGLVSSLDPTGGFFGHDKVEGVAALDHGRTIVLSNDSDFGVDGLANDAPPFQLHAKILPNGQQDDGEFLAIDTTRLPAATSTATVTITVTAPHHGH
ncbi:MAG TPA: esterase-like activity of phytase family protein, partial [Pseudonocardiaceae bacterium]|nr:esterase-like activity of phytase family protein [Pseudonocardiaceae bacterium]